MGSKPTSRSSLTGISSEAECAVRGGEAAGSIPASPTICYTVSMNKPLKDLDPKLTEHRLRFSCPACPKPHMILIDLDKPGTLNGGVFWIRTGDTVENLTTNPSIDGTPDCKFHGWIRKGQVSW